MKPLPQLESDTEELIKKIAEKKIDTKAELEENSRKILKRWLFEAVVLKEQLEKKDLQIKELETDEETLVPRKSENMKKGDLKIEGYADEKTFYSRKKIVDNIIRKLWDWGISSIKNTERLTNLDVRELTELLK